jgi:hypothetical protein
MLEVMEDRTTPSIAFTPNPVFGAEATQFGSGNYTLPHQVELIFWGSSWSTNTALMGRLQSAAQVVVNSTYLQGAHANYGTAGQELMDPSHQGGVNPSLAVIGDPAPPPGSPPGSLPAINKGQLASVVHNTENANLLPDPDSVGPTPIYAIITPPGVTASDAPGARGYHFHANTGGDGLFDDHDPCDMIWASVSASPITATQVDAFTLTFSHELVETMTDGGNTAGSGGITVTPPPGWVNAFPANAFNEIADNEPAWTTGYGYRLNAVNSSGGLSNALVQAYWASNRGAYLVEDGNSQTFTLTPNYVGSIWAGNYALTVQGDQLGANFSDTLTIDASSTGGVVVTLNGQTATFDPKAISGITVQPGGGTNTINIERTLAGVPVTITDVSNSSDTIAISPTAHSLNNLNGSVTINGSGLDTLTVNDQTDSASDTYTLTTSTIGRTGFVGITYSGVSAVTVNGGSGGTSASPMTYNIKSTLATTPVTIGFGNGANTINVGGNTLDSIQGGVSIAPSTLLAQRGTDALNVNDQGSTAGHTYFLASIGLASGSVARNGSAGINYSLLTQVTVNSGTGADVFNVLGTALGTATTINAGGAVNTGGSQDGFQVGTDPSLPGMGNNPLDNIRGPLTINPQNTPEPEGTLHIDDLAAPSFADGHTYTFSPGPNQTTNLVRSNAAQITYGPVNSVALNTSTFNDRIFLGAESAGTKVTLQGEGGDDTLTSTLAGTHTWAINNNGTATVDGLVTAVKMSHLVGGPGVDVFQFGSNGHFSGTLSGGSPQGDWLDYSAYNGSVNVNLAPLTAVPPALGSATGTLGVTNIQNVMGSKTGSGNNTLTGNAQGNILVGGGFSDTITGGSGASLLIADHSWASITGGNTVLGDILIGGRTSYDTDTTANFAALMAILTEWQSGESTRVTKISNGSLAGAELNLGVTVFNTTPVLGLHDTLTEASSLTAVDWFFTATPNTWNNHKAIDHINNT